MSNKTQIKSKKSQNVHDLGNGMFRVGEGTSSIVRTIDADQLAEWEASPYNNWPNHKPTSRSR